jgi:carboxyl-terminal processing protease
MKEIKKKENDPDHLENFGQNDLQLEEANQIMKDIIALVNESSPPPEGENREVLTMMPNIKPSAE